MPKIKLDALQEGMVVAADVKNLDDMLLIPSGCELTSRHIKVLQTWGVPEVDVKSVGDNEDHGDPLAKLQPEHAAQLVAEVKGRFWSFDEANAAQQELLKACSRRAARAWLAGRGPVKPV